MKQKIKKTIEEYELMFLNIDKKYDTIERVKMITETLLYLNMLKDSYDKK